MKVVSFVAAASNSGKTTLIEKVVAILKARGMRVAVIKHASEGFDLDRPGKDSWRFQRAGADAVVLAGPETTAVLKRTGHEPSIEELLPMAGDADIVIIEGFKERARNKIEVFRSGVSGHSPLCITDPSILALVSNCSFDVAVPWFDQNDPAGVATFILEKVTPS